ncbi:hypothetical protein [Parasitella parasitica]|uniref:Bystin n=1 Tax=Parasitella parasitica TaxID=35722 RepID=A0A0B7N5M9_9FUNG|nr:hypothetical protein [Parasitella parasitica]
MGKDNNKNLLKNTATRLYSPWQLDDNKTWIDRSYRFGLIPKDDDFKTCLDENMANTILRIEQEQLERNAHLREEDSADEIGCSLARFQSTQCRLPKALKIIPSLSNWGEILFLTDPSSWTPQATCQVTKLFLANIKATQTRQYLELVLLHAMRGNLVDRADGQLDPALYRALKKALVCNPALFMKGLLFPLCESNSCTVAEACILANVLGQTKIPAPQTATALLRLSEQTFTLPICILVRVLLEKRQPLPYRVVDILTFQYFCQRERAITRLPLTWYQSLQIFTQSYSRDMVPTQKRALLELIQRVSRNDDISAAIDKTIKSAIKSNDQELETTTDDSDDTVVYNEDSDSNHSDDSMLID